VAAKQLARREGGKNEGRGKVGGEKKGPLLRDLEGRRTLDFGKGVYFLKKSGRTVEKSRSKGRCVGRAAPKKILNEEGGRGRWSGKQWKKEQVRTKERRP